MSIAQAIKQKGTALLDGTLLTGVTNVPLFDGKVEGAATTFVLMDVSNISNENDAFDLKVTECNWDFDIVSVRESTVKSEVLEEIGDQIKTAINPTKNTIGITLDAPLQLVMCELASETEVLATLTSGNKIQQSKRITFRTIVTQ